MKLGEPRLYFSLLQDHSWLAYEDGRHEGLNLDEPESGWAPVLSLDQDQSWLWHTVKGRRKGLKLYEPGPGCSVEIWRSSLVDCYTEANSTAPPNVNVRYLINCVGHICASVGNYRQLLKCKMWGDGTPFSAWAPATRAGPIRYWLSSSRQYTQFTIQAKSVTEDVIFQGKRMSVASKVSKMIPCQRQCYIEYYITSWEQLFRMARVKK